MARINVEDSLYKDIRFVMLIGKLGSLEFALGAMVRAWSLAQEHYLNETNDRLIPLNEWQRQLIRNEIIDVGLAEKRDHGIYVVGSFEQFDWLIQRQSAGKRSGESRRAKKEENASNDPVEHPLTPVQRPLSEPLKKGTPVNGSEPLPLTLSLSHTLNNNNNNNTNSVVAVDELEPVFKTNPLLAEVVSKISAATRKSWVSRYEETWLSKTLINAIEYHIAKENALDPAEINDWGVRLVKWLRRERKPSILDPRENSGDFIAEFESELQKNEVKP